MVNNIDLTSPSELILNAYEYQARLGQTNPTWQPVPQHHYPLSSKEIAFYIISVLSTIVGVLGIFIGFVIWAVNDLSTYVLIWTLILIVGIIFCLVMLYLGGKDRRTQEKQLIEETNRKQKQMGFKQK